MNISTSFSDFIKKYTTGKKLVFRPETKILDSKKPKETQQKEKKSE